MDYQEYLQSDDWILLKARVTDSHRCAICGSEKHIHIHHQFYRRSWYDTLPSDLIPLCKTHHRLAHSKPEALTLEALIKKVAGITKRLKPKKKKVKTTKPSKLKGAFFRDGRWISEIKKKGKVVYLGRFDNEQQAHDAYCDAAQQLLYAH